MCPHESDVALCGITAKNVAISLSLTGWKPLLYVLNKSNNNLTNAYKCIELSI